jgi:hypothetical protein
MTEASHTLGCFRQLEAILREATAESRVAYEFNATSYTFSAMTGCVAAERALEVLRQALGDEFSDQAA